METDVLIIGGGATGTGIARGLTLRGLNTILIEKKEFNAGASGGNHGLLHSSTRSVHSDPEAANECQIEQAILKKQAAHCIEETGGLFVAVKGDDENYIQDFLQMCKKSEIKSNFKIFRAKRSAKSLVSRFCFLKYYVAGIQTKQGLSEIQ